MPKYLQIVESHYPLEPFLSGQDPHAHVRLQEAAVCHAFELGKGRVAAGGVGKVILEAGDVPVVEQLLDVLRYRHPLGDHPEANASTRPGERYVGDIHHALMTLGAERGWDLDALQTVYERVRAADYRFSGTWVKPKWNAERSCRVGVEWRTTDRLELGFTVLPTDGEPSWIVFLASPIGLGRMEAALGRFAWQGDREAVVWHKNKRDFWRLNVETRAVEFVYGPAQDGNPHGEYALGKMYLDGDSWVEQDREKALHWLKRSASEGFGRAKQLLETL